MLLPDVLGDTFHAEDLDLEALAVGEGIFDVVKGLLVDLVHMNGETCGGQRMCELSWFLEFGW